MTTIERIKKVFARTKTLFPPHPDLPANEWRCKCDLSKPRKLEDTLPNAEELQAAGICMWCGFPED